MTPAVLRKGIDEPYPWRQRSVWDIILRRIGAEGHKGLPFSQQKDLGIRSAQFLKLVVPEKFIEVRSGTPVAFLYLAEPVFLIVRTVVFNTSIPAIICRSFLFFKTFLLLLTFFLFFA